MIFQKMMTGINSHDRHGNLFYSRNEAYSPRFDFPTDLSSQFIMQMLATNKTALKHLFRIGISSTGTFSVDTFR